MGKRNCHLWNPYEEDGFMRVRIIDSLGRIRGVFPNMETALLLLPIIRKKDLDNKKILDYELKETER